MDNLVPIGQFSRICGLTIKALRYYDDIDLLKPAYVDKETNYRYYSFDQSMTAEKIRLLKYLEMPLEKIKQVVRENDPDKSMLLIEEHKRLIERKVSKYKEIFNFLQKIIISKGCDIMTYEVKIKEIKEHYTLGVRMNISLKDIEVNIQQTMNKIFGYLPTKDKQPVGYVFTRYFDEEFDEDNMDIEIGIPISGKVDSKDDLECKTVPKTKVAFVTHKGSYEELYLAYQFMTKWIQENKHQIVSAPYDVYVKSPNDTDNVVDYITEVVFPIK